MVTTAIILAGGLGTRLRSVVQNVPKPMAPVNGKPFLEHQIDYWIDQGIKKFVISVGYKHETICDHFGNAYGGIEIDYAVEPSQLGTGGGLLLAASKTDGMEPLLVLNGDTYFPVNLATFTQFYDDTNSDWCFSLFRTNAKDRYMGLEVLPNHRIASLHFRSDDDFCLSNGGVYMVRPSVVDCGKFKPGETFSLENDGFPAAMKNKQRLFGMECSANFIDIGIPEDYLRASDMLVK